MQNELYQEMILDHNKKPRNRRAIVSPDAEAEGHNPLCGDEVKVYLKVSDGQIKDVSFEGHGCAISTASASLMTDAVMGKSVVEVEKIFGQFHRMLTEDNAVIKFEDELEKLEVFSGVKDYPMRVKCATLAWHTLHAARGGMVDWRQHSDPGTS